MGASALIPGDFGLLDFSLDSCNLCIRGERESFEFHHLAVCALTLAIFGVWVLVESGFY